MATTRERLHALLDEVPGDRLSEARAALESLTDPVIRAFLDAPDDDEETTADDLRDLAEARAEFERGETVPLDDVMAELAAVDDARSRASGG